MRQGSEFGSDQQLYITTYTNEIKKKKKEGNIDKRRIVKKNTN